VPDSASGGAAFLGGEEIVNDARTLSYLEAGYGPPGLKVNGGCACPRIRELIECDSLPYVSPIADPAPWYDSSVPESADFVGFLTTEFEGLGSTFTREPIDKITGGAVLGRLRAKPRTLTWRGFLFGRSDCAVRFGLSWLTAQLNGSGCVGCGGEDLDLMVCCPELTENSASVCGGTAIVKPDICPPFSEPDAFRTLKKVGLLEGPVILSQRKIGCGSSSCEGDSVIIEIEFSLLAGNPYLHGCPVCLCSEASFPTSTDCLTDAIWVKVFDGGDTSACLPAECPPALDCTRPVGDPCPPAALPDIPAFQDSCFCDPIAPVQFCCSIPADSFGQFFEGAPVIEIYSGSAPMRATTIRFFDNPLGIDCCDTASDPCLNCDSLQIRLIPAFSTMTIDGTTRQVTVQCPGVVAPILADHLTVTPFAWPLLQCIDSCICIETEGIAVASDATVTVYVVPREM